MTCRAAAHCIALAFALGCLVGCGGEERVKVHPVEGKLSVSGTPAANARIAFHPLGRPSNPLPVATTDADGAFRLTTFQAGDGAPEGEYAVTVIWPDVSLPQDECV